jgi:hypothetical protein
MLCNYPVKVTSLIFFDSIYSSDISSIVLLMLLVEIIMLKLLVEIIITKYIVLLIFLVEIIITKYKD